MTSRQRENETMDTSEQASTSSQALASLVTKRKNVDVNGHELPDSKRTRAAPDTTLKLSIIKLILHWHESLARKFGITGLNHIDEVADITSILWTIHTKLRQDANGNGNMARTIRDDFKFKINETEIEWNRLKPDLEAIARLYGVEYGTSEDKRIKIGTLGSYLGIFVSFRPRMHEVRTGTGKITMNKTNGVLNQIPIEQFGLASRHAVLMNGCTFNPTIQSSMKQSLGPMTIAINLCMQTERQYQRAWKQAFINSFNLFPHASEISEILAGSKRQNDSLLCVLADLAMWGTTRSSNKAAFPVSLLLCLARTNQRYVAFFGGEVLPNTAIDDGMLPDGISDIDFSGKGAYKFWRELNDLDFHIKRTSNMHERTAREVLFHAIWGTQKEDLGLLRWMTGHEFLTRRQIGTQFVNSGTGGSTTTFKLIKFKYICKLSSASQSDMLSGGKGQICRVPTFSGKCTQRVNLEGDLFKTLLEARDQETSGAIEKARLMQKLFKLKDNFANKLRKENVIRFGTTAFYKMNDIAFYGDKAHQVAETPECSGKYFYGQEEDEE